MADELKLTVVSSYSDEDGVDRANFGVADLEIDVTTKTPNDFTTTVTTSESAIPLNGVTAAAALFQGRNLDETNFIEIRVATGGTRIVKVPPGEPFCFRFGSGITAPFWIADTASCKVEHRIVPA